PCRPLGLWVCLLAAFVLLVGLKLAAERELVQVWASAEERLGLAEGLLLELALLVILVRAVMEPRVPPAKVPTQTATIHRGREAALAPKCTAGHTRIRRITPQGTPRRLAHQAILGAAMPVPAHRVREVLR